MKPSLVSAIIPSDHDQPPDQSNRGKDEPAAQPARQDLYLVTRHRTALSSALHHFAFGHKRHLQIELEP